MSKISKKISKKHKKHKKNDFQKIWNLRKDRQVENPFNIPESCYQQRARFYQIPLVIDSPFIHPQCVSFYSSHPPYPPFPQFLQCLPIPPYQQFPLCLPVPPFSDFSPCLPFPPF